MTRGSYHCPFFTIFLILIYRPIRLRLGSPDADTPSIRYQYHINETIRVFDINMILRSSSQICAMDTVFGPR
ncbi:hypothetical protein PR001_g31840 [Phytophthora rubi]|uniref:Secreted protein n=1 Tax=Phytophthora rubi TaxID=129364 RepID=A0A6A3GF41_9STRA|nr:hypothetical protein PR001_g31840 [Phytophthora rubi]